MTNQRPFRGYSRSNSGTVDQRSGIVGLLPVRRNRVPRYQHKDHDQRPVFVSGPDNGIILGMKSVFVISVLTLAISIACSASKSAGSPTVSNADTQANQVLPQNENTTQDKPKCSLTLAGAPAVNGLRLGMTTQEVLAAFPGSGQDPEVRANLARPANAFGASTFVMRPAKYENKEKFADVSQISFTFLDGRVSTFTVHYDGPDYSHVDKFVTKFVEGSSLPGADQWEAYVGMDTQMKTLTCSEVEIRLFAGGPGGNLNYVLMRDLEADKKLKERKAKANATPTPS